MRGSSQKLSKQGLLAAGPSCAADKRLSASGSEGRLTLDARGSNSLGLQAETSHAGAGVWKSLHVCADETKPIKLKKKLLFFSTMGNAGVRKGTCAASFPWKYVGRGELVTAVVSATESQ